MNSVNTPINNPNVLSNTSADASSQDVLIRVQPTPNPNAWKFVLSKAVLHEGKATFSGIEETTGVPLAAELMSLPGVKQIHFFGNVITVTHRFDIEPEEMQRNVCAVIQTRMNIHDPDYNKKTAPRPVRADMTPEIQTIEEILDRTIRPGLQGDGGDIDVVKFEENKLYVLYQGACGTCPSSTQGTLMAIESILRNEFNPTIEVVPL